MLVRVVPAEGKTRADGPRTAPRPPSRRARRMQAAHVEAWCGGRGRPGPQRRRHVPGLPHVIMCTKSRALQIVPGSPHASQRGPQYRRHHHHQQQLFNTSRQPRGKPRQSRGRRLDTLRFPAQPARPRHWRGGDCVQWRTRTRPKSTFHHAGRTGGTRNRDARRSYPPRAVCPKTSYFLPSGKVARSTQGPRRRAAADGALGALASDLHGAGQVVQLHDAPALALA